MNTKPTIKIKREVLEKLKSYVKHCDIELGGLGLVVPNPKDNSYEVTEVFLLNQEAGSAHTDLDANDVAKLMFDTKDKAGELNFWWHSHVNMGAFWSGTDSSTIAEMSNSGMCVAMVLNKKGEYKCAVGETTESGMLYISEDTTLTIDDGINIEAETIKQEIKDKVKQRLPFQSTYQTTYKDPYVPSYLQQGWQGYGDTRFPKGEEEKKPSILGGVPLSTITTEDAFYLEQCPEWANMSQSKKGQYENDIVEYYWAKRCM